MLHIITDKTGFPVVNVAQLGIQVSWLPFTKIQLEHFIADTNSTEFDRDGYERVTSFNPRISPAEMDMGRYEGIFLTGILPAEARRIAQWMGNGYDLPTASEWKKLFNFFYSQQATEDVIDQIAELDGVSQRARAVTSRLDAITTQEIDQLLGDSRRVCDQMLMRLGVMEYIYENNYRSSYAGQGMPNRAFHPHTRMLPRDGRETLRDGLRAKGGRIKQYGFRLIRRK